MQESDFYKKFEHFLFGSLLHKISVYFFKLRRWDKIEGVKLFTGGGGFFAARRCACFLLELIKVHYIEQFNLTYQT